MHEEKLVSVIVPVYNGAGFVIETLASVAKQTHNRLECIIIDDGSTDNTADIVRDWITADRRFAYHYQSNKGLSAARNAGLDRAKGEFIQFLDADDVLLPTKIGEQLNGLSTCESIVAYTDYATGTSADIFKPAEFYRSSAFLTAQRLPELIKRWESTLVIPPHCFLFSADFFREKKIRFDTALPNHEDFDCWVNIFRLDPAVEYIDRKLCLYRISEGSMSKNMRSMGDGFLQVLTKQIAVPGQPAGLKRAIRWKRRETLKRYNRLDRMTMADKLLSFRHLFHHYTKRIGL